ncbi:MAG: N-6 DNA methylase, partial [Nitrospira defluvii]|nr:N-6 DNA methylase [Nitrospira defluvii]
MTQLPPIVSTLIDRFEHNRDSYKSQGYNETQLRREFLDPFFEALGWDVANKQGHAEAYKDVIHEDAIKIGGNTKAPDYCFRIGGARKFFLEAKKPAVNLKDEISPAYQLRRYAWSAKLPLSILTDFEEFAVYDCRTRPNPSDKPSTGRILYLTYRDYQAKWDEIASIFTKEAVLKGSFDKYAVTDRKRGTATVDAEFLKEIETWRESLAKNLAARNPTLSVHELNFAVQRTIDRLIFLRICEDRSVEPYGRLQALLNGQNIYSRLCFLYEQADDRYNSGLFHFHQEKGRAESPDDLTPRLKIDDKVLKELLVRLYYPQSPYEFSVFPIEILGQVYEQFLGKVIRLTAGHQAKIEEKPEVKKAGGVYYTPAYIVEYIVKHTVGALCEGKQPKQISKLTVLDPACGSGSFLIGVYRYLLNYHRDWYVNDGPEKHRKELFQAASGEWRLTTQEKKRILLNNIYGVDIDSQAVEVTKLSLLLKVLEGESDETLKRQLSFVHERALPDLGQNIKCGNSLIGPDYFAGQLMPDEEEMRRVNPFDWKAEFPEIMKKGGPSAGSGQGFDAVIGNPPYVRQESLSSFKDYLAQRYEAYDGVADLYAYFMEKSVALLREGGRFSFIVSSSFLRTTYGAALRRTLKKQAAVLRILDFGGLAVFENAKDTYVCIPLLAKMKQPPRIEVSRIPSLDFSSLDDSAIDHRFTISQERLTENAWSLKSDEEAAVFDKVMKA